MPQLDTVLETKTSYNSRNKHKIEETEREIENLLKGKQPVAETAVEEEPAKEEKPLTKEEETFKKRYGDLRRHLAEKEKEWNETLESIKKEKQTAVLPPKSEADIKEWMRKYPDVAAIVDSIARKRAEELFNSAKQRFDEIDAISARNARETAENEIRKSHPDFDKIANSDDFHNWADEQPKWVQDAVYENDNDPKSVIRVLDLYKVDKGMNPSAIREKQKDAARAVGTKNKADVDPTEGGTYYKESAVNKMSAAEYEKKEPEILEAIRKGRFIYDLSGGAR